MKRRGLTVLLGALLTALLAVGVMTVPLPYVVLKPGPTVNTLGSEDGKEVIKVTDAATSTSTGQLRLTTVGVQPRVELVWAIQGWFSDERAVVPRELIYPPDQTQDEVKERNAEEFKASQTSAETAALVELGYPIEVTIRKLTDGGAAAEAGVLKVGDVITSVNGTAVPNTAALTDLIQAKPAGTTFTIAYKRGGVAATTTLASRAGKEAGTPLIGVQVGAAQHPPFKLQIELDEIGGPSAGLMFALGIVDKLRPEDLTGGKVIAGTGTIDDAGRVGPIGGIPQKLRGAKAAGAVAFLVPAENCAEAQRNAVDGLTMAKVGTLDEALTALATLRSGGTPTPCAAS
jgi:PDZ domain-containing protein